MAAIEYRSVGAEISNLGWSWTPTHAIVRVNVDGITYKVAIPVTRVQNETAKELHAIGCPMERSVGACTVSGFFDSISRAVKRVTRSVKKLVPKAIRRAASRVARTAARAVKTARKWGRSLVRSPLLKGALGAASLIPGAAALTVPTLAALAAADQIDRRIAMGEEAAKRISRGLSNRRDQSIREAGVRSMRGVQGLKRLAQTGSPKQRQAALRVLAALRRKYAR